jgi:hypothetical protein
VGPTARGCCGRCGSEYLGADRLRTNFRDVRRLRRPKSVALRRLILKFRQSFEIQAKLRPFSLEDDDRGRDGGLQPWSLSRKPRHEGSGDGAAGYSLPLPFTGYRLLSGVSGRFFRRAPTQASCPTPVLLLPLPGVAGFSRSGLQWAQQSPEFLIPAIRAGTLASHLCRRHSRAKSSPTTLRGETPSPPAPFCSQDAQSAKWPGVPSL